MALIIERINSKLEGEFSFRGKKWSVPFTVTGDAVQFRLNRRGRRLALEVMHVEINDETRRELPLIEPICSHFGICGGCRGQHLNYDFQLSLKTDPIIRAMEEKFHLRPDVIPAQSQRGHRHSMDFSVNGATVGFHPAGDFAKIMDVEYCPVQSENGNIALKTLRDAVAEFPGVGFNREDQTGVVKYATIRFGKTGSLILTCDEKNLSETVYEQRMKSFTDHLMAQIQQCFGSDLSLVLCTSKEGSEISCTPGGEVLFGTDSFEIELGGKIFNVPYDSFFQPNPSAFDGLVDWSSGELEKRFVDAPAGELLDLYSGAGILSSIFAGRLKDGAGYMFQAIRGYDFIASSVDRAMDYFKFFSRDVEFRAVDLNDKFNPEENPLKGNVSLILADPPRAGLSPALVKNIIEYSNAPAILYISCNPESQIRDMEMLKEKYSVLSACIADCFPHTGHLEQAVVLARID